MRTVSRLLIPSPYQADEGHLIGADPRKLFPKDFSEAGVELMVPTKAIRAKCLDCCGNQEAEVRKCVSVTCPLWPMRMGSLPKALRKGLKGEEVSETNIQ